MKNNRLVKVSSILFLITIALGCFPSHASPTLDKLLLIIAALRTNNGTDLSRHDQSEVNFARTIYNASNGMAITATNQGNMTCTVNGTRVTGNFSVINGHVISNGNVISSSDLLGNSNGEKNCEIHGDISTLHTHYGNVICHNTITSAQTTNGSINAKNIDGNAISNNGSIKVKGNIGGAAIANNGSVRR